MKGLLSILAGGTCLVASSWAQGTLQFYADMRAPTEVRPGETETAGHALFTLDANNNLGGYADFSIFNLLDSVWIEDGSGSVVAAPTQITFDHNHSGPFSILVAEWNVTINQSQANQLVNGEFLIKAQSARVPPNYVAGQLALIPEPSTMALFVLSGYPLLLISKRLKKA